MDDRQANERSLDRRELLAAAGMTGVAALAGCTSSGTEPDTETTREATSTTTNTDVDGPLAGPPTPDTTGVPQPDGEVGNLRVLDWAGFEAAVSYSFDDGQPSQLKHYDALNATGAPMTFYLTKNVDFDGWKRGWRQVAADGHELGDHTVSHPHADLTGSSWGDALDSASAEIERCADYITKTFDQRDVWTMAAPFGDDGWIEPARESSLFVNRGVGGGTVAPRGNTDPYDLPCYMAREGDTAETFNAKIDATREAGEWQVFLFHSIAPTDQEWYAPVNVEEITASIKHAQTTGDLWVGTVADVAAYWRGARVLRNAERETDGEATTWSWSLPTAFPSEQHVRVTVDGGRLEQNGETLAWDDHGYYEVALDAGSLTLRP